MGSKMTVKHCSVAIATANYMMIAKHCILSDKKLVSFMESKYIVHCGTTVTVQSF